MSRISCGRLAVFALLMLVITGVFYLWLAGAGLPALTALIVSTAFAGICVGFSWWNLGLRLRQDQ